MGVNIDWSLFNKDPNIVGNFLQGQQEGNALRVQSAKMNVLSQYASNPTGAINAMAGVDPVAAKAMGDAYDAGQTRQAKSAAAPFVAQGDTVGAVRAAGALDPKIGTQLATMSKDGLAAAAQAHAAGGQWLNSVADLDPADRPAFVAQHRQDMIADGVPSAQIDSVMPMLGDTAGLRALAGSAMSVADQTNTAIRAREAATQQNTLAEHVRHDQVDESQGQTRLGYEGQRAANDTTRTGIDAGRAADYHQRTTLDLQRTNAPTQDKVIGGILAKKASGAQLSPAEQATLSDYQSIRQGMYGYAPEAVPSGSGAPTNVLPGPANPYANGTRGAPNQNALAHQPIPAPQAGAAPAGVPHLATRAQVQALKPGSQFVWTDGQVHTRR